MSDMQCVACGASRDLRGVNLSRGAFALCSFCRDEMERPLNTQLRETRHVLSVAAENLVLAGLPLQNFEQFERLVASVGVSTLPRRVGAWQRRELEIDVLRAQATQAAEERDRLRLRVAELEEKYCNHNVTAILTADGNNRLRGPA